MLENVQTHGAWQVNGPAKGGWPPHCSQCPAPEEAGAELEVVELVEVLVDVWRVVDEVTLVELELDGGVTTDPALKVELIAPTLMLE